jgi:uncharacterized protein (UPF0218 family)
VPETVLTLQESLRSELKEPLGQIYTDADALVRDGSTPLLAVGDVVTAHLLEAGHTPALAIVDEQTERSAVDEWVAEAIAGADEFDHELTVTNEAATLSETLLLAIRAAIAAAEDTATLLRVDGEEDLATLPVVCRAPDGATVVYGQPGEGMVRATVDGETKQTARTLLEKMDGDTDLLWHLLGC